MPPGRFVPPGRFGRPGRFVRRPPNPFRRPSRPLAAGAPGHPLPVPPQPEDRAPAPGPAIHGAPGLPLVADGEPAATGQHDDRLVDPAWELVAVAVVLVAVVRLTDGVAFWGAATLAGVALLLGALEVLGRADQPESARDLGIPVEALLVPGVTGFSAAAAFHAVPVGLLVAPGLVAVGALAMASIAIERRILARPAGATAADRTALLGLVMVLGFLAFVGTAAAIPGALVQPAATGIDRPVAGLPIDGLVMLAAADGLVAGVLGFRLAALRSTAFRGVFAAALTYAAVVAISAAALRAMALPRLLGPALLTLVLYLWAAYRGVGQAGRRDARWLWEILLLAALGALVVAWNLVAAPG